MAKNDYFVVVCRILSYLYICLKSGVEIDRKEISPERLDINPKYWGYIIENMQESNCIKGICIKKYIDGIPFPKVDKIEITPDGIAYLYENSMVGKAREFLKTLNEAVPGL